MLTTERKKITTYTGVHCIGNEQENIKQDKSRRQPVIFTAG